ncbi:gliding motility lipoprotein GldD [Salinimicrobium sp. GXAS 041]|uniref:gliding motility lipoprotein GldD n=1 Tax=Salinimicrobium sp. GXAS 041 TaxID=3400806 RepID=UPI003C74DF35
MKKVYLCFLFLGFLTSCGEDPQPKPKGFLALEYPAHEYEPVNLNCPYSFEKNTLAQVADARGANACWLNLEYQLLKGTIFITYQPVQNNLDSLLRDAQKLPLQHTIKADVIEGDLYENPRQNTYGMFYEVTGDAASQAQFYLTDSLNHFMTGSVYFEAQPNYDSILPAAAYLKKDIRHLMETVSWRSTSN